MTYKAIHLQTIICLLHRVKFQLVTLFAVQLAYAQR